jgi:non-heme chloroperoxidase
MKTALAVSFFLFVTVLHAEGYRPISVKTPDGLTLSAQEWGNPDGPELLFIHGLDRVTSLGSTNTRATLRNATAS